MSEYGSLGEGILLGQESVRRGLETEQGIKESNMRMQELGMKLQAAQEEMDIQKQIGEELSHMSTPAKADGFVAQDNMDLANRAAEIYMRHGKIVEGMAIAKDAASAADSVAESHIRASKAVQDVLVPFSNMIKPEVWKNYTPDTRAKIIHDYMGQHPEIQDNPHTANMFMEMLNHIGDEEYFDNLHDSTMTEIDRANVVESKAKARQAVAQAQLDDAKRLEMPQRLKIDEERAKNLRKTGSIKPVPAGIVNAVTNMVLKHYPRMDPNDAKVRSLKIAEDAYERMNTDGLKESEAVTKAYIDARDDPEAPLGGPTVNRPMKGESPDRPLAFDMEAFKKSPPKENKFYQVETEISLSGGRSIAPGIYHFQGGKWVRVKKDEG